MARRMLSAFMLCLILFSVFAVTANILAAMACEENEPVVIIVNDSITLIFPPGTQIDLSKISAYITTMYPPPPPPEQGDVVTATSEIPSDGFIGPVWNIFVVPGTFSGRVYVRIYYPVGSSLPYEILQTDIIPGDVNADGKVNCKDLLIITMALGSVPGTRRWNPNCDLNHDNRINLKDLCIALHHLGESSVYEWTPLQDFSFSEQEHYVQGSTDHFSIFGGR